MLISKILKAKVFYKRFTCISIIFFSVLCNAQDNTPYYLKNSDWLKSSDKKKWDKLVDQIPEADKLLNQSNDYYLQVSNIDNDQSLDEGKKQKQKEKLEQKAIDLYTKSLLKYKDIYTSLYKILDKNIGENEKKHPAYQDMLSFNDQAAAIYGSKSKLETDDDREQLSQANEYELNALEKGVDIFNTPADTYKPVSAISQGEPVDSSDIQINAELYRKYKEYVSDNAIPDPLVVSDIMQREGDTDFSGFKDLWNKYLSEEGEKLLQQQQIAEAVVQTDSVQAAENMQQQSQVSENDSSALASNQNLNVQDNLANTGVTENNTVTNTQGKKNNSVKHKASDLIPDNLFASAAISSSDKPEYRVQLAACRIPLNLYQISSIYSGPLSVTEIKEGSLYKYQIRSFSLYTDAQKVCSQTKVDNAYLEAYKGSSMLQLSDAVKDTRTLEQQVKQYGRESIVHELEFAVQIVASKVRLTSNQLNNIYNGQWPVTIVFEDGWYKYQLISGNNLQQALDILDKCGVDKAFLVAYKNGRRQVLYKALHEYKSYTP